MFDYTENIKEFNFLYDKSIEIEKYLEENKNDLNDFKDDLLITQLQMLKSYLSLLSIRIGFMERPTDE